MGEGGGTGPAFKNQSDLVQHSELNKMYSRWQEDRAEGTSKVTGRSRQSSPLPVCLCLMAGRAVRPCVCRRHQHIEEEEEHKKKTQNILDS